VIRKFKPFLRTLLPEWLMSAPPGIYRPRSAQPRRMLALSILSGAGFIGIVLAAGHLLGVAVGQSIDDVLFMRLYWPLIFAQALLSALVFSRGIEVVNDARARRQWDLIRSSAEGVSTFFSSAWARAMRSVTPGILSLIVVPRLILAVVLLIHQMAFRGEALSLLGAFSHPAIIFPFDMILLAAVLTAALLLPIQSLALEAAIGLLMASVLRGRTNTTLVRLIWIFMRVSWAVSITGLQIFLLSDPSSWKEVLQPIGAWLITFGAGAIGDWGLSGLHVSALDQTWRSIPWASTVGLALLGIIVLQTALTRHVMRLAVRRAQRLQ
jgi:hypothetical protein